MKLLYLFGAILLICLAHLLRVFRWTLFIEVYEKPPRKKLTQALAIGYMLNYVLPYKLGDIVRAVISRISILCRFRRLLLIGIWILSALGQYLRCSL